MAKREFVIAAKELTALWVRCPDAKCGAAVTIDLDRHAKEHWNCQCVSCGTPFVGVELIREAFANFRTEILKNNAPRVEFHVDAWAESPVH